MQAARRSMAVALPLRAGAVPATDGTSARSPGRIMKPSQGWVDDIHGARVVEVTEMGDPRAVGGVAPQAISS
jgi:hypothetical protein